MKNKSILVQGTEITIASRHEQDYISLTDMVRNFNGGSALIEQWLKNKDTVLFLVVWERLNNPVFNSLNSREIKMKRDLTASSYQSKNGLKPRAREKIR